MEKPSLWKAIIKFINKRKIGEVFYRQELLTLLPLYQDSKTPVFFKRCRAISSIDTYRNNLDRAGFIGTVGRGQYMKLKPIPKKLTTAKIEKYFSDKSSCKWMIQPEDISKFY